MITNTRVSQFRHLLSVATTAVFYVCLFSVSAAATWAACTVLEAVLEAAFP